MINTKTTNKNFDAYYQTIYGERWKTLRESLLEPADTVPYSENLKKPYLLDNASIIAARALKLPDSGIIFDACAAPGGKSLVIASRMTDNTELVSNELSMARRRILTNILDAHLEENIRRHVKITGIDAAKLGRRSGEHEKYDAILLDAPCSSERHVLHDEKALSQWTLARPRFLSQRQWSLLSAAFLLLKKNGCLVYSTCAITPEENDNVVSRLVQKYGERVIADKPDFTEGEETQFGRIILPDLCNNMGPMYVARIKKLT